ncbi:MAG: aminomethyl-transferring glycine dehydrogenase subunit GcvPB [Erysipelotrichaceae bacterium]
MESLYQQSRMGVQAITIPQGANIEVVVPFPRTTPLELPQLSQIEVVRHYSNLALASYGVDQGFYPLGSCTMKYNPKINEDVASLAGFSQLHPLQPLCDVQGALTIMQRLEQSLCTLTGMSAFSLAPAAGAHGEFAGMLMVKKYHETRNDVARKVVLVPDSAHGTNPASAHMCGFEVISVPSDAQGFVDVNALKALVNEQTAAFMLTNPNTLGLFEPRIKEIADLVHQVGGLLYYDGANLNAIMGLSRPKDMGFDIVHLNLHKTFSTPHGGGGPGSGPLGVVASLVEYLPNASLREQNGLHFVTPAHSIGRLKMFYGNFMVYLRALTYLLVLGKDGLKASSIQAIVNANYVKHKLKAYYPVPYDSTPCMHEFVCSVETLRQAYGIQAIDVAKALIDYGMHPPTMYFPLVVKEALMIEPTETESKATLDRFIAAMIAIYEQMKVDPSALHAAPTLARVSRIDEVQAARHPILRKT